MTISTLLFVIETVTFNLKHRLKKGHLYKSNFGNFLSILAYDQIKRIYSIKIRK